MKHLFLVTSTLFSIVLYLQQAIAQNSQPTVQDVSWAKARNWKIYSLPGKQAAKFPTDTLKHFKSKTLEEDSMRVYLANIKPIESTYGAVWQGYIIGTCELDNAVRKIIFSTYGGFFFDPASRRYFEIPDDLGLRKEWHAYLINSLMAADPDATIP